MHLNLPKSYTRQFTLLVLYFVTGISDLNEESNSKYPVLPKWGFIHDFTELLAGEVAGAGEAGGGRGVVGGAGKACIRGSLGDGGVMVGSCGKKGLV